MTVKEIVEKYLKDNGFDGLASEVCGCGVEDGLAPCDMCNIFECQPAYKIMCDGKPKPDVDEEDEHDCPGVPHELFTTVKPG